MPRTAPRTRAVAIGGGHGLARSLRALRSVVDHITAVVTVADDGGSSGRLRRDLGILPPGDLRMALTALADEAGLAQIVDHRFGRGELAGHSLGNLMIVALEELSDGDLVVALDRLAGMLAVPGRVVPCTTVPLTLHATASGSGVTGQAAVAATPRLERVWLEPDAPAATPEAVAAIDQADLVVLGPGSLYTSLLPNLLVPGIAAAVSATNAPVVYVANLREQAGETEGMSVLDHLDALTAHVPELSVDLLVAHAGPDPAPHGRPLLVDRDRFAGRVKDVMVADLLDGDDGHEPAMLARVFDRILQR